MFIYGQFGIVQNLQMTPIAQTSFLVGTFFYRFLQQTGSSLLSIPYGHFGPEYLLQVSKYDDEKHFFLK